MSQKRISDFFGAGPGPKTKRREENEAIDDESVVQLSDSEEGEEEEENVPEFPPRSPREHHNKLPNSKCWET